MVRVLSLLINLAVYDVQIARTEDIVNSYANSFAFVGDPQFITIGDALLGTKKLKYQFKYIADTAEERKLAAEALRYGMAALSGDDVIDF